jgi:transposase
MPTERIAMRRVREMLRLSLDAGLATREVARRTGVAPSTLREMFRRFERIKAHVLAVARLHGDDTTVPVLAKGKTNTGRLWVYVRDDGPFAGPAPPAAVFHYSRDRRSKTS